ncbi:Uncharacterised protein [Campylobacter jejuni]|nr:Uncharacterised protein [Campylobacter jejuni]
MALSDTAIRRAKITGKAYTLSDDAGLSLAVYPRVEKPGTSAITGEENKSEFPSVAIQA